MKVVGFIAPKGAGKDAACKILVDNNKVLRKLSFAAPFKKICQKVFGLTDYHTEDPAGKEREFKTPITLTKKHIREIIKDLPEWVDPIGPDGKIRYNINSVSVNGLEGRVFKSPRELLQIIGTDLIRDRVWKDWHVNAALSDKALALLPNPRAVYGVTDIRFENEFEALVNKFGPAFKPFYVERPEAEERLATATHESELVIPKLKAKISEDNILTNDGSLEEFEKVVLSIQLPEESFSLAKKSRFVYGERE